jgi:diguanylate cyclase (GGDEF)-like protein
MTTSVQSSDARPSGRHDTLYRVTQELRLHEAEVVAALERDAATLLLDGVTRQRKIRLIAAGIAGLLTAAVVWGNTGKVFAALVTAVLHAASTWAGTRAVASAARASDRRRLAIALAAADLTMVAALATLVGGIALLAVLVVGGPVTALASFRLGTRHGAIVALVAGVLFVVSVVIRLGLGVAAPGWGESAFALTAFGLAVTALTRTLGDFRVRLDALRLYCKLGELGEGGASIPIDERRTADDLTFLAGSFDAMCARLTDQVGSDPLTGCANRRTLESRLLADLRLARRRQTAVAVAVIDVDHFKQINDTRGHPVGDLVLQQIASLMLGTARESDTVSRVGGDEFVIVLPDTDRDGATTFIERLRERVMEFTFGAPGAPLRITMSAGVAVAGVPGASDPDQLLADADRSLYRAKTEGRNRVCVGA